MSTYRIGLPSELKRELEHQLPRQHGYPPIVRVTPRDSAERKCAAYAATHYEVRAFYTTTDANSLSLLEGALRDFPGVYLTTQVVRSQGRNEVTNPGWPVPAGAARRGFHDLRPQVIALICD
jgi:hypothetical protein